MLQHKTKLDSEKIDVKIVAFDNREMANSYRSKFKMEWPVLIDESMDIYKRFGLQRANMWTLINPMRIARYVIDILSGALPGKPGKDLHQLGGDVLIDDSGLIRMYIASKNPHDRPSADQILAVARSLK